MTNLHLLFSCVRFLLIIFSFKIRNELSLNCALRNYVHLNYHEICFKFLSSPLFVLFFDTFHLMFHIHSLTLKIINVIIKHILFYVGKYGSPLILVELKTVQKQSIEDISLVQCFSH